VSPGTSVVALTVSRWLFLMYLPWKYKIHFRCRRLSCIWYIPSVSSSTLSTTSHSLKCHLLNLHYHAVVLSCTCIFSRCCLLYDSVLQAGIIFRAFNWLLFFLYPGTKGTPLGSKCDKTHSQQPRIQSFCTLCTSDNYALAALWPDSVLLTTVLVFHQEKNWLCCKCVINYEVRFAIFSECTHCRMVVLTTTVLLDPWRWDQ